MLTREWEEELNKKIREKNFASSLWSHEKRSLVYYYKMAKTTFKIVSDVICSPGNEKRNLTIRKKFVSQNIVFSARKRLQRRLLKSSLMRLLTREWEEEVDGIDGDCNPDVGGPWGGEASHLHNSSRVVHHYKITCFSDSGKKNYYLLKNICPLCVYAPLVLGLSAYRNNLTSFVDAKYLLKRLSYLSWRQLAMETAELEVCLCHLPAEKSKATCVDPSTRNYRPSFRENKPKTLVLYEWKRAFWACVRENWVYKFGHRYLLEQLSYSYLW